MNKTSIFIIALTLVVLASIFLSPVFSQSTNPCGSCHGGYYQYLDILEGNGGNVFPTTITVGQTSTVTVVIQNNVNTASYTGLSSVSLTLTSQNGHFSVATPTYNIGTLPKGTAKATWQITAVSAGSDSLVITASARNSHQSLSFSDSYAPSPQITIQSLPPPPPSTYAVTMQLSPNGTTLPTTGIYSYASGTSVTFTAMPNTGFNFDYWLVNGATNTTNPTTLTMDSNLEIVPVFSQKVESTPPSISYTVTLQSSVYGTTTPPSGTYSRTAGDTLTLIATTNTNYRFEYWLINGVTNSTNPLTLVVTSDATVEPTFTIVTSPPVEPAPTLQENQTATTFPAKNLTIALSSPTAGEKWQAGTTHNIEWNISGSTNSLSVTLEYSSNNGKTWITIAKDITNNGSLALRIPSASGAFYIRASATDTAATPQNATAQVEIEINQMPLEFQAFLSAMMLLPFVAIAVFFFKREKANAKPATITNKSSVTRKTNAELSTE